MSANDQLGRYRFVGSDDRIFFEFECFYALLDGNAFGLGLLGQCAIQSMPTDANAPER